LVVAGKKVFISVDAEGLPYIVSPLQLMPGRSLFGELRSVATRLTRLAASLFIEHGYNVVIADSHGLMVNIDPLEMPRGVEVIRGFPRSLSMVAGARGSSYGVFLGYHARAGVDSVLAHSFSSRVVYKLTVNGLEASEYLFNALLLGEWGVPIGLVAGSNELGKEVEEHTPWAVWLPLSRSTGYLSSASPSIEEVEEELREAVEESLRRSRAGELKPLRMSWDTVEICIDFMSPAYAETAALMPGAVQDSGRRVCYRAASVEEAYRAMESMVYLGGFTALLTQQMR